jgi:zinc/manganese transport system substrate-binding protein
MESGVDPHDWTPSRYMRLRLALPTLAVAAGLLLAACGGGASTPSDERVVVATTAVLGAVVGDAVGEAAEVAVLMESGVDPHDWTPSARDIERVMKADLVVANGLALEEGLEKTLEEAEKAGVPVFRATDHITVREVGAEEPGHEDEAEAAGDPHFWVDPIAMQAVVAALAPELAAAGIEVGDRAADLQKRLGALDGDVRTTLAVVPEGRRKLVTGHESMGYFADRYAFELVGTVIPGLSSQGEVSAGQLAELKAVVEAEEVTAIFAEVGTPAAVVEAIGRETGVEVVELPSHTLPDDGSYFTFIRGIATTIAGALA